MKFNTKKLFTWFIIFYLITDVLRGIVEADSIATALKYSIQPHIIGLTISVGFVFFLYVLSSYYVFYRWYNKKPFWANLLIALLLAVLIIWFRYLLEEVVFRNLFGFGNYRKDVSLWYYFFDNAYYLLQYCGVGIVFYFWQYSKYKDERTNQLLMENQRMELDLLRSQTNPHFLFNTLNNIYALVHSNSDKALNAIEKLSLLLRYSLYKTSSTVLLEDEISQIKNFIDLESIRHKDPPHLKLNIEGVTKAIKIPQFLLLPFVENAFKHGKLHSIDTPILITLKITDSEINYTVINDIEDKKKDKVGGLGLDNLKKRIALLYGDKHTFIVKREHSIFKAQLIIPLQ